MALLQCLDVLEAALVLVRCEWWVHDVSVGIDQVISGNISSRLVMTYLRRSAILVYIFVLHTSDSDEYLGMAKS